MIKSKEAGSRGGRETKSGSASRRGPARGSAAALAVLLTLFSAPLAADWVGSLVNRIFIDPASIPEIVDGWDNGDEVSFILETTPADTGSDKGHAAWMSVYIPPGAEVIGAEFVLPASNGGYDAIPAEDTDKTYDGWGSRGNPGYGPTTGATQLAPGYVNEVQQDTGIFYSTDVRTQLVVDGVDDDCDGSPDLLDPTGGPPAQIIYNRFDWDHTLGFGIAAATSGNGGKGNTPVRGTGCTGSNGLGCTWTGVGAIVSGPDTYYTNAYDPGFDDCSDGAGGDFVAGCDGDGVADDFLAETACPGPFQRIAYPNSKVGGSDSPEKCRPGNTCPPDLFEADPTIIFPAYETGTIRLTALPTSAGWDWADTDFVQCGDIDPLTPCPLPAATNMVRFVHGARRLGELENARITLRITDAALFTANVFVDDGASEPTDDETFCLDSTGGDTSDTAAKDNPFRYYEPQHECSFLAGKGNLVKLTKFVNNVPSSGASLSVGDVVSYQITFTNTSGSDLTLVDLYDRAEDLFGAPTANLDLLEPGDPLCAWPSYDGDLPGPAYQAGSAAAGEARWNQIATFSAGAQVNVFLCAEVTGGAINARLDNSALVDYNFSPLPADRVVGLRSTTGGTITTSISGTVYVDTDGSGDFTPGEAGAAAVTVSLYEDSNGNGVLDFGEPLVDTRLTLSDGSYIFAGIPGGDYIVVETDPPGWISTGDKDNLRGPCNVGNGCNTIAVTVAAGGESTLNDFFDTPLAGTTNLISGTTFVDRDEDQSFDPGEGEVGQGGILVRLYRDEDGDGILDVGEPELQSQFSDALGQYVFTLTEDPDDPLVCTGTPGDCHYIVVIDETTLPPGASLTTPNLETAMFGMLGDPPDTGNDFGFFGGAGTTGGVCFAVADSVDELVAYTLATMAFTDIGPTGTSRIEAIAFDPGTATLCAANEDRLGTIDLGTGAFTQLPSAFGTCTLAGGSTVAVDDVDGLSFDPFTGLLWGATRRDGGLNDVLVVIDPATGKVAPDGVDPFGSGVTCVEIDTSVLGVTDIDDLAIDPTARAPGGGPLMFATANQDPGGGGSNDRLVVIDTTDGSVSDIARITLGGLGLDDVEGLGFDNDGVLYATTGNQIAGTNDKLYSLNKSTAVATQVADLFRAGPPSLEDYESVDCLTAGANVVTGTVFADGNGSGALDPGEVGQAGVTVSLYLDVDGDDMVDPGVDELLQTFVTGASGAYSFSLGAEGDFVLETDFPAAYPQGAVQTTDNVEEADFVGFNQTEAGNDFGFALPNVPQITKLSSAAGGYVAQGDVITYTLIPRISGPQLLTNVEVEDFIPVGTTLVAGSVVPTQSEGPDPLEWEFGDHEPGTQGVFETSLCPAQANLVAAADTYVRLKSPEFDNNFGGRNVMETRPAGTDIRQGLVRFNLSSIPSNATVTDAVLQATSRNNQADHLVEVRESTTAWTEGSLNNDPSGQSGPLGATWNAPNCTDTGTGWDGLGGDYSTNPFGATVYGTLVPNSTVQSVSVTTLVAAWVAGTTPNNGFALYATGISTGNAQWGVKEGGDAARLIVDYLVPTPGGCNEVTTLIATQDNWLREDATGTNNGSDVQVRTRPNPPNQDNHAILQFDLAPIPPGSTINSATFGIWEETTRDATQTITLYRLTESWTEGASTWLSRDGVTNWSTPGGTFDSMSPLGSFNPTSTGFRTLDVTALAQSWLDGALPNNGLILVATTTSQTGDVRYTSRQGTAAQRPYLEVDWTLPPDPTTNDITAVGTLVSHGETITVTMTLTSAEDDTNVVPGALTINGVDGASALCGPPSPASQAITAGTPITFDWTCVASAAAGELLGRLTFEAEATGDSHSFANAVSHTVMVTRPLVFSVQVDNPLAANQTTIVNTGIADSDQTFPDATDTTVDVVAKGVLGDQVWLDTDGDGVQDIGEEGIPNVEVTLYDAGANGVPGGGDDVAVATTTTGADGRYLFTDLPPGTYFVDVTDATLPAGLTEAPGTTDPSATRMVTAGEVFLDLDFGYVPDPGKAVIGNYVWSDADNDGRQDPGEPGIGGVTLDLIDVNAKMVVATTTTAADGSYLFSGLDPGKYRVEVTDTGGVLAGYSLTTGPQSSKNPTVPIVVAAGEVYEKADFGYFRAGLGTIGSQVWLDEDGDGFFDSGSEPGLAGVSVDLVADLNGDGVWDPDGADDVPGNADDERVIATARTAADGTYSFTGLSLDDGGGDGDADYLVVVSDVDGVTAAMEQTFGTAGVGDNGQADPYPVELSAASPTDDTADFGFEPPNVLGDRVWSDANGDGVQDAAEAGIGGVLLNLLDSAGNPVLDAAGNPITETTAPDGTYLFGGVDPDDYIVEVDSSNFAPGGTLEGYLQTGDPDEAGTCAVCDDQSALTMLLGVTDLARDFGYRATGAVYPISGTVFADTDGDGFNDGPPGESGFAGVTLELRDFAGNLVATTTTDANGDYQFPDLPDGDYTVVVTDEAGIVDGYTLSSGLDAIDVEVAGGPAADIDFGYVRDPLTASIGNTVWFDSDGDGLPGPAEPGIPGIVVDLYEDDGDGVLEPTVELFSGRIDLDGDGDVDAEDDGFLAGIRIIDGGLDLNGDGTVDGLDNGTFNGAAVIAGEIDLDGSGGVDAADTGTLVGDDGLPVATGVTDGNGQYIFPGLAAGSYFVDVREGTVPDSTADGIPDLLETAYPGGVDPAAVIPLSEGERYEDANFGYVPRPGTAAFGDRVWNDADGDGEQDDGELGIPGVDIIVSGPSGDTTLTTGADGFWMITGLTASSTLYSVNLAAVNPALAGLTRTFPGDTSYQVTVNDGDLFSHLDYGFTGGSYGSIGDLVWLDLDGDGIRDAGEPGIEGVTVSLIADANGDGIWDPDGADDIFGTADDEPILETATTGPSGDFSFTGVPPGDYLVDVTDIGGVLTGLQKTAGAVDTDDNSQADPYAVTMPASPTAIVTGDFGYTSAGGFGSIGNKVWHDLDGDGVRDLGEPGLEGATVQLWVDVDGNGMLTAGVDNLVRTSVTDTSGEYEFQSVPLADYLVVLPGEGCTGCVLEGLVKTSGSAGVDDNSQSNPYPVTLTALAPDDVTADFGFRADPAGSVLTVGGKVFEDADNNAAFGVGIEPEVEGATVFLFRDLDGNGVLDATDPLIGTATTNGTGDFLFTDLPPGDYLLAVSVDGTSVDDYLQTTQASSGGVQAVSLPTTDPPDPGAPDSTGNDFGFWNGGVITNPITLAWFRAEESGSGVSFEWMTATETGNVGFNLYGVGDRGLRRLNDRLIPSRVIDSLEPQRYVLEAWGAAEESFVLEDVDLLGVRRYHGPFERGQEVGAQPRPERIPWDHIRTERAARRQSRLAASRGSATAAARQPRPGGGPVDAPERRVPARLSVAEDGIYRVTYEQLLAAGIDLKGAPSDALAVTSGGEPVAIRVESGRLFGPGAFIEFVGQALDTLYTRTNVYTLRVRRQDALRVGRESRAAPAWGTAPASYVERREVDRDRRYILTAPGQDPWYEDHLVASGGAASREFDVEIDAYAGGTATLEVELWGLSEFPRDPDHHVELQWNDFAIAEERFDGRVVHRVATELASGSLLEGTNRLRLTLPGDGGTAWDMVALDRLWVSYARSFAPRSGRLSFAASAEAFEVESSAGEVVIYRLDDDRPVLVDGQEYLGDRVRFRGIAGPRASTRGTRAAGHTYHFSEASALLVPGIEPVSRAALLHGSARLLVISHADFLEEIQPLVEARRAESWSVAVVEVDEIYARESHGVVDPQALRDFIASAHDEHETEAVLLVGGDTYDYHDNLGLGSISFVPTPYTATDQIVRFAPVDPLYGDVDGDGLPEVAVGRLPVRTPDELAVVVARILEYDGSPFAGTALLSADAYDVPAGYSFATASDGLASRLPADWTLQRAYIDELGTAGARQALIDGVNAGVGLTSYFGHSGPTAWSFQNLFNTADAAALDNAGRPTVVTQWGCWNNYHVTPRYNTLGHKLLLSGDRGAAAVLGAATLTQAPSERRLGELFFSRLGRPGTTLGGALVEAKRELARTDPDLVDVILGWTLLGDPSQRMDR